MKNADEQLMTIFSAALDCETTAAREAFLDKACEDSPALRERVEALLRAHNRSVNFLREPPNDPAITAAFSSALLPGAPTSSGRAFQEEFRQLLRSRLILVHLLLLGYVVMASALSWSAPPDSEGISHRPDHGMWWWLAGPFIESLIGIVVLRRARGMSLRSLRIWELICFANLAAFYGYDRFAMMVSLDESVLPAPMTVIGFMGLASLQGFSMMILAYGVLIPNTRRRSLIVVAGLFAIAIAAIPAAAAVNPLLREHIFPLIVQAFLTLMFPAAIAVFAAARASTLQQRAFDAERRAERMGQYTLKRKLGEGGTQIRREKRGVAFGI